ncbi:MAG: rod shape-determining protein MreC [Oscillibacter sp.]|nr:rod shape-determining protein MreC [Oscillibacter sp.]
MKNFLKNNGLWILFAAAVISVSLALMSYFSTSSAPLVNLVNVAVSPFRSAYTAVATWFNDKQNYYRDVTTLLEENAALRKEIAKLEADLRQAADDSKENEILRDALELRKQRRDLELESAIITERAVTNWTSSLTLNKGTSHGVETGDVVIDGTGSLVGVVRKAGWNWCTVLTLVDTDTSLGAQVFRTKDLGLAVGNFSLMEENRLRLEFLPAGCQLLDGDLVQTSGLGGYYPSGLVIGTVEEVLVDESGAASYAILAPSADLDALTEVFVVKSFDIVT